MKRLIISIILLFIASTSFARTEYLFAIIEHRVSNAKELYFLYYSDNTSSRRAVMYDNAPNIIKDFVSIPQIFEYLDARGWKFTGSTVYTEEFNGRTLNYIFSREVEDQ